MALKRKTTGYIAILFSLLLIVLCSCQADNDKTYPPEEDAQSNDTGGSSFEALSLTVESGQSFNYYLYSPAQTEEGMSLILYLHGGSGKPASKEGDLSLLTAGDGLPKYVKEKQIVPDSYIVFPQLPYGKKGWSDVQSDLSAFVKKVANELKCDQNKISVTGHSMGGKGVWDMILAYPNAFYKAAPLSGNVTLTDANVNKLKDKPIWAFVGNQDTIVDPQSSVDFIDALSKVNSQAEITVIEGYGHFDVPKVYLSEEYNLLAWLTE